MDRLYLALRSAGVKLEQRADGKPLITGYAAVFYDGTGPTEYEMYSDMIERIAPGAFDDAIKTDDVRGLFNHDPNELLGRNISGTMKLIADQKGLRYEIDPGETTVAKDVLEHLRRGDVTGSSFGFQAVETRWTDIKKPDGKDVSIRELLKVRLYDVGPVTFPAYTGSLAGVRAATHAGGVEGIILRASSGATLSDDESRILARVREQLDRACATPARDAIKKRIDEISTYRK